MRKIIIKPIARKSIKSQNGFTLIEVALTLGILSFGILMVVGMVGQISEQSLDIAERRDVMRVKHSLQSFLDQQDFAVVSGWVDSSSVELIGNFKNTKKTDAETPTDPNWQMPGGSPSVTGLTSWIKAELKPLGDLNGPTPRAKAAFEVDWYLIPNSGFDTTEMKPVLTSPLVVLR